VLTLRAPADADSDGVHTRSAAEPPRPDQSSVLRMTLLGSNPAPKATGLDQVSGTSNYFVGNDPRQWRTNVLNYAKVRVAAVYPGVDLVYYGNHRQLEYDFIVAPGANPSTIELGFAGVKRVQIDPQGQLALQTRTGNVRWHKPVVYQEIGGVKHLVDGHYIRRGKNAVGFAVPSYDRHYTLVIDPVLEYSTYLGGNDYGLYEGAFGIAVDSSGNAYIVGQTASPVFPTAGAFQKSFQGFIDAFVTKLDAVGTLVYSTYLGGGDQDGARSVAVDSSGNAFVTGYTRSLDFPTLNAFQPGLAGNGGQNAFVTELNPSGNALVYSTYLGGSGSFFELGLGIAVDSSGNAYITGSTRSSTFPTRNAFQATLLGNADAFVTRVDTHASGSDSLVYSTYLGGSSTQVEEGGNSIAVDSSGNAYVTGIAQSVDFPTTVGAFQSSSRVGQFAFVSKLDTNASGVASLVYSTLLGGFSETNGNGIAVDPFGHAYVTGYTADRDFPTTVGAFQTVSPGSDDAFVTKLNATGSDLVYSTYLGGRGNDYGQGIALDSSGNAYVTGRTGSIDFPAINTVTGALSRGVGFGINAFVTALNSAGNSVLYSTYLGGSTSLPQGPGAFDDGFGVAVDGCGKAYVAGVTTSSDFPTVNAIQSVRNGTRDAGFVTKIRETGLVLTSISVTPGNPGTVIGANQPFTATGIFSDCSTQDLTSTVVWGSDTPSVATITGAGMASAIALGTSVITATDGGVSGSTRLTVGIDYSMSALPSSLTLISPSKPSTTSSITLVSKAGSSDTIRLSADWVGAAPTGVDAPLFSSDQVTVPPSGPVSSILTLSTSGSPSPGTFHLRVTGKSSSGVVRTVSPDLTVTITVSSAQGCCTGAYVNPAQGIAITTSQAGTSPSGKYSVEVAAPPDASGLATINVRRASDRQIVLPNVSAAFWGFSPDDDRFVTHSVQSGGTSIDHVGLYDLTSLQPRSPIWPDPQASTLSSRILFSPSGHYLLYVYVGGDGKTHLTLVDVRAPLRPYTDDSIPPSTGAPVAGQDSFGTTGWGFGPNDNRFVYGFLTGSNDTQLNLVNLETKVAKSISLIGETTDYWQFSPCGDVLGLVHQPGQQSESVEIYNTTTGLSIGSQAIPSVPVVLLHSTGTSHVATANGTDYILGANTGVCGSLSTAIHSPADILMVDGQGHRTGFDPSTGSVFNEIPGGSYTGIGTEPETVTVPYVMGTYLLYAFGLDSLTSPEPFRLTVETADAHSNTLDAQEMSGMASKGSSQEFVIVVDDHGKITSFLPVVDTTPPVITLNVSGTLGSNGWYKSDVIVNWSVADAQSDIGSTSGCATGFVTSDTSGTTFTCTATSGGGTASSSVTIMRDATAPTVACASSDGHWHASDVTLACTASDSASGLANPGDASFSLSTQVPSGAETSSAATGSRQVCDNAGNCTVAGPITANEVDRKPPSIVITAPAGTYLLGQLVAASYSCVDGGSGVASCSGPVANGANVNTATVGANSFTVNAVDQVGNSSMSVGSYSVVFNVCPLYATNTAKKSGSAYPIKLQLCDAAGTNLSSASIVVHAVSVTQVSTSTAATLDDTGSANPDFDFRYDPTLGGYIFNLSTNGYSTGTYSLNFTVGSDPTVYSALFAVR
jgi:hypothetical protein